MTQKALVLEEFGKIPVLKDFPKPKPGAGQLLVKVEGSTVNPSDRYRFMSKASYLPFELPAVMGLEGTGKVVEANGQHLQNWVGKRVSFTTGSGSWAQYSITSPDNAFEIDEDVPLASAASGMVNPLTCLAMLDIYHKFKDSKGLIHTAAASALGRMLNKRCQTLKIPLLNIVRKQEQAELLKKEGAEHVIVTTGEWQQSYKAAVKQHGFNVFFDALGGGPVLQTLISGLVPNTWVHVYGRLEEKPFQMQSLLSLHRGIYVTGFLLLSWMSRLSKEERKQLQKEHSSLLKGDLSTTSYKVLKFAEIEEAIELSTTKTAQGKVTIVPQ